MLVQRRILEFLDGSFELPEYLHGGIRGRSPKTLAEKHRRSSTLMSLDLANYFPSVTRPKVEAYFRDYLGASPQVARMISRLTTREDEGRTFLPQGAPSSTVIANLVFSPAERRVCAACDARSLRYGRYIDDLVFSGDRVRELPRFVIGTIRGHGFGVNRKKTKMMSKGKARVVLGLNVGAKLTPKHAFQAECRRLIQEGRGTSDVVRLHRIIAILRGKASYARTLEGRFPHWLAIRICLLEQRLQLPTLHHN